MKDFVIKDVHNALSITNHRFRIGRHDDGRVKLVFEERDAHRWRHVAGAVLDDNDMFGYLDAAGVKL
jgi:hypothetical protein